MAAGISADAIRERAYLIWEREGRPHGRDFEHWVRAEVELIAEGSNNTAAATIAPVQARTKGNGAPTKAKAPAPKARRPTTSRAARSKSP